MKRPNLNQISGGPFDLKQGWALMPFVGKKSHYWKPDEIAGYSAIHKSQRVKFWKSLCGVKATTNAGIPALMEGNWPRCTRCTLIGGRQ